MLERLPKGAEVHSGKSKTLQDAGILDAIHDPSQYDALRHRFLKMDRQTQAREIRKLIAAPDFMLGSVNAVTEDGVLVAASATASQLGPYANTAGKVILVVGSQKIVPNLETALRRIREYVLPWEDAQVRQGHQYRIICWQNADHRARVGKGADDRHTGQTTHGCVKRNPSS